MRYTISVVGLGKIGLALAAQYSSTGSRVIGCDINPALVDMVTRGEVPPRSEPGLAERVNSAHQAGRLSASIQTTDAVAQSNVVVVIVPLVVDSGGVPDFTSLDSATEAIANGLRPGTLVLYETTLPLGATRTRFRPMLERSGLRSGLDFDLAFSPERVLVGRIFDDLRRYPKVVGGVTPRATKRAVDFYRSVLETDILAMPDAETAEFVKLSETTYRDVNIALANELARFADRHGVDATTAFRAANTQPYSHLHQPGVGVGGHCIPVYPRFLIAQDETRELGLVRRAREVNDSMAEYAVDTVQAHLGNLGGRSVLILGVAYRAGQKEARFSSALLLIATLKNRGAKALLHDPLFAPDELLQFGAEPVSLEHSFATDAIVVQAAHQEYAYLDWSLFTGCRVVVDGRNSLDPGPIRSAGIDYVGIGQGARPPAGL